MQIPVRFLTISALCYNIRRKMCLWNSFNIFTQMLRFCRYITVCLFMHDGCHYRSKSTRLFLHKYSLTWILERSPSYKQTFGNSDNFKKILTDWKEGKRSFERLIMYISYSYYHLFIFCYFISLACFCVPLLYFLYLLRIFTRKTFRKIVQTPLTRRARCNPFKLIMWKQLSVAVSAA